MSAYSPELVTHGHVHYFESEDIYVEHLVRDI